MSKEHNYFEFTVAGSVEASEEHFSNVSTAFDELIGSEEGPIVLNAMSLIKRLLTLNVEGYELDCAEEGAAAHIIFDDGREIYFRRLFDTCYSDHPVLSVKKSKNDKELVMIYCDNMGGTNCEFRFAGNLTSSGRPRELVEIEFIKTLCWIYDAGASFRAEEETIQNRRERQMEEEYAQFE